MIDGMLAHPVPATPVKALGADKVIAVYFNSHWCSKNGPRHIMEIIGQSFSIAQANVQSMWQVNADVVLEPEVSAYPYDAFNKASELVKAGEDVTRAAIPQIKSWLEGAETTATAGETAKKRAPLVTNPGPAMAS